MAEKSKRMVYIGNAKRVPVGESRKFLYPLGDETSVEEAKRIYEEFKKIIGL